MTPHASLLALLLLLGCRAPEGAIAPGHAKPAAEIDGMQVRLRPDATAHLGIATETVVPAELAHTRTVGGDVVVPIVGEHGAVVVVEWPLTVADRMRAAESLAVAEGDHARTVTERAVADAALVRARQLLADRAGSVRGVEEAQARADAARTAVLANAQRIALIQGLLAQTPKDVWVRVPVYAGERTAFEEAQSIRVAHLGPEGASGSSARRIAGPASANPAQATIDLFLTLANAAGFAPGERVAVTFDLPAKPGAWLVPWSAVVYDADGAAWTYEEVAPNTFARRPLAVDAVRPPHAVVTGDFAASARVVGVGAAELFGLERRNGM